MRLRAYLFLKRNYREVIDALRYAHLERCALSLTLSKRALEAAQNDLASAFAAYDKAVAEYRLHHGEVEAENAQPIRLHAVEKGDNQWQETEEPMVQSKALLRKRTLKTIR